MFRSYSQNMGTESNDKNSEIALKQEQILIETEISTEDEEYVFADKLK